MGIAHPITPVEAAESGTNDADLLLRILPAVVSITSLKNERTDQGRTGTGDRNQLIIGNGELENLTVPSGTGSGVLISEDGLILTNEHVIRGSSALYVHADGDGRTYEAKILAQDVDLDLALLKIEGTGLTFLEFASPDSYRVGDAVFAIGNPLDVGMTVTKGIISAKDRRINEHSLANFVQTDASINLGNSGGPLVDVQGRIVGINTQIASAESGGSIGLGFAVSSDQAQGAARKFLAYGELRPAYFGCKVQELNPGLAASLGMEIGQRGLLVTDVEEEGPAEAAGLKTGDIVVSGGGVQIDSLGPFISKILFSDPGHTLVIGVLREGEPRELEVLLGERPAIPVEDAAVLHSSLSGLRVQLLDDDLRGRYEIPEEIMSGLVVIDVETAGSPTARAMRPGFVLWKVQGMLVESIDQIRYYLNLDFYVTLEVWTPDGVLSTPI